MKFPLAAPAFPPVELSAAEREAFEALAARKLAEALAAFDAFRSADRQVVDRARWKPVKTREGVTVFRERLPRRHKQSGEHGEGAAWRLPRLLGVGTLLGTLDDVMYGTMSPSASSVMVKADYCEDEVVDAQVLHEMRGPTLARPFQFLGLKWLVKRHPVGLDAVVLPRDLVYLETTGVVDRADGSRVGHFLIHSVDLPERCGCLRRDLGIVRSRISSCFLFRERAPSSGGGGPRVDVFMTGQVEPNGHVMDRAALVSAASGLMCFGRAVLYAQHRKLAWRLRTSKSQQQLAVDKPSSRPDAPPHRCCVCARPFGTFAGSASSSACEMCGTRALCSRCVVSKTLSFVGGGNDRVTHRVPVTLCRPCILVTSRADAATIAREEIRAGEYGSLASPRSTGEDDDGWAKEHTNDAKDEDARLSLRSTELSLAYLDDLFLAADPLGSQADDDEDWKALLMDEADDVASGSSGEFSSSLSSDASGRASESLLAASSSSANTALSASTRDQQQQQLWAQISALQRVAEATYHFAKENTEQTLLMSSSSGGAGDGRKSLVSLLPPKTLVP